MPVGWGGSDEPPPQAEKVQYSKKSLSGRFFADPEIRHNLKADWLNVAARGITKKFRPKYCLFLKRNTVTAKSCYLILYIIISNSIIAINRLI